MVGVKDASRIEEEKGEAYGGDRAQRVKQRIDELRGDATRSGEASDDA
jgi:hypothetical protein